MEVHRWCCGPCQRECRIGYAGVDQQCGERSSNFQIGNGNYGPRSLIGSLLNVDLLYFHGPHERCRSAPRFERRLFYNQLSSFILEVSSTLPVIFVKFFVKSPLSLDISHSDGES